MERSLPALAIATVALTVAAMGSSTSLAGYGGPAPQPAPSAKSSTAKVELVKTKFGKVLADGKGHTLYLF